MHIYTTKAHARKPVSSAINSGRRTICAQPSRAHCQTLPIIIWLYKIVSSGLCTQAQTLLNLMQIANTTKISYNLYIHSHSFFCWNDSGHTHCLLRRFPLPSSFVCLFIYVYIANECDI